MKIMKTVILMLCLSFTFTACINRIQDKRESILDGISHVEDSIYYKIDSLPMLCEKLKMKSQFIDIGGCKLFCEVAGKGIPLVVINGGPGGTHHCFHPWFKEAESFSKVIYYDQRGCGQSDYIQEDGYTFRQAIDDLDKMRQKLNIDKWIVCGYSYGGALAQYYTISYPHHVSGLVLIGSTPLLGSDIPSGSRQQMFITEEERQKINEIYSLYRNDKLTDLQLMYNKEINGDWKRQHFYRPAKDEIIRQSLYEWVHDNDFRQRVGWGYKEYNFKDVFTDCPIPTMMCEGKWDLTWVEEKKDIFRKNFPLAQFVLFENSGHTIFSEEPDLFFLKLKEFTDNLTPLPETAVSAWKKRISKIIDPQEELFHGESRFIKLVETKGSEEGIIYYTDYKKKNPDKKLFTESNMNNLGYSFWKNEDYDSAIKIFTLNLEEYPGSAIILENLGDSFLKKGDKYNAKKYYNLSLKINPDNKWIKKQLKELGE